MSLLYESGQMENHAVAIYKKDIILVTLSLLSVNLLMMFSFFF